MRSGERRLAFLQEALQVDDEAFVDAFANHLFFIKSFDFEDEAPAVDFDEFSSGAHALARRGRGQVFDIDDRANRDVPFIQVSGDGSPGGVLHKRDHHWGAEDFDSSRSYSGSGVFVNDDTGGFSGDSCGQGHIALLQGYVKVVGSGISPPHPLNVERMWAGAGRQSEKGKSNFCVALALLYFISRA